VVLAQSITLFLFASETLEYLLASRGLPTIPLVPVSSSQAVVGAILGIGLYKGGGGIRYNVLGGISLGWLATPIMAGTISFFLLFFVDNVFDQPVHRTVSYRVDVAVIEELARVGIVDEGLTALLGKTENNAAAMKRNLQEGTNLSAPALERALDRSQLGLWRVDQAVIATEVDHQWFSAEQLKALHSLSGRSYEHVWQFHRDLAEVSPAWRLQPDATVNKLANRDLRKKLAYLDRLLEVRQSR